MATPGFGGKILLVDLTTKEITRLDTDQYAMYGGGHGTSTALFWEYSVAPGKWNLDDAFNPHEYGFFDDRRRIGNRNSFCRQDKRLGYVSAVLSNSVVVSQQFWRHVCCDA